MSNQYISQQCQNMKTNLKLFEQACQMAAMKDDGKTSKEEEKALKRIKIAGEKYVKEIEAAERLLK